MKGRLSRLLAIESPIANANVMLRLLEPQDSCHQELRRKLYSGSYDKPFVVDNGQRRFLHFDFEAIQSAMELSNPKRLALAYTRKMMAFLLFNRTPCASCYSVWAVDPSPSSATATCRPHRSRPLK